MTGDGPRAQALAQTALRKRYLDEYRKLYRAEKRLDVTPHQQRMRALRSLRTAHEGEYRKLYRREMERLDPRRAEIRKAREVEWRAEIERLRAKARRWLDRADALEKRLGER